GRCRRRHHRHTWTPDATPHGRKRPHRQTQRVAPRHESSGGGVDSRGFAATERTAGMSALLPKHPIPMKTVFRNCFLVNFAVEPELMQRLLPPPLEPDLYDGKAF